MKNVRLVSNIQISSGLYTLVNVGVKSEDDVQLTFIDRRKEVNAGYSSSDALFAAIKQAVLDVINSGL